MRTILAGLALSGILIFQVDTGAVSGVIADRSGAVVGTINSVINPERQNQLALKLYF